MCSGICLFSRQSEGTPARWRFLTWVVDVAEVLPAGLCSAVTLRYTREVESFRGAAFDQLVAPRYRDVSPEVMLASCLVLGCSISSFAIRRQAEDPLQVFVFLFLAVWAVAVGHAAGASANLTLLGYAPWSVCAAMVVSYAGHRLARHFHWRAVERRGRPEEKDKALD